MHLAAALHLSTAWSSSPSKTSEIPTVLISLFTHKIIICIWFYDLCIYFFKENPWKKAAGQWLVYLLFSANGCAYIFRQSSSVGLVAMKNLFRLSTRPHHLFSMKAYTLWTMPASILFPSFLCQISATVRSALVQNFFKHILAQHCLSLSWVAALVHS